MIYGIEDQQIAPPGSGYTGNAVHFAGSSQGDGPTYLQCSSLSASDNSLFAFSIWILSPLFTDQNSVLFVTDPDTNYTPYCYSDSGAGEIGMFLSNADNSLFAFDSWTFSGISWQHLLYSADMNQSSGNKVQVLYVNDTLITPAAITDASAAFSMSFNGLKFIFGEDTFGKGPTMDVQDVWIAPGIALHDGTNTIPEATRRLFIGADRRPVDPSGFPASAILFTGDETQFSTNQGSGGSFSLTGSLTAAATNP